MTWMDDATPDARCAAALHTLHRLGKVADPWRAGMVVTVCGETFALTHQRKDGPHAGRWVGVCTHVGDVPQDRGFTKEVPEPFRPVLTDPATVGALHALAEEAVGRRLELYWCGGASGCDCWFVWDPNDEAGDHNELGDGATRGEALAAALVALAESRRIP